MAFNYHSKSALGWGGIILISIIPVFLWYFLGAGINDLRDYASITHSLGELFGLVGMTMLALTFVLSTRIHFIEDIFGGLDKVYIAHGILGGTALILILAHPIFLVLKFIPNQINLAAKYLLPSASWEVNFGIIALAGIIGLVFITLYVKIKYHVWKFTHEFLGLMFFFAVLHIFMVRGTISVDNIFTGYYYYASVVSAIGLGAFSYSLFLKNRLVKNAIYKVKNISKLKNIIAVELVPEHKPIHYKSGQFVFMRFYNEKLSKEAHPFSIASQSDSETIKIVIKKLGDFTHKLEHLNEGDKVSIEGPYGRFHFQNYGNKDQVWISSGIGITPFIGMAEDIFYEKEVSPKVFLYHTANDNSDFIGHDIFSKVQLHNPKFKFIPWNSKEKGRINIESIKQTSGDLSGKEFLICGSSGFKRDIIAQLIGSGVKKSQIHDEAFDFR